MKETWYIMEDGSLGDPREIAHDERGILRHSDGRVVAYAPHGPRSRGGVDADVERAKASAPNSSTESDATRDAVEIPEGWRDLVWPQLASLASKVSPERITTKESAVTAIEKALQRRAAAAGASKAD